MSAKPSSLLDAALEKVATKVANDHIHPGCILGLGSGSTVARFAKALGVRNREESLKIKVVPSSMQSWLLARQNDLSMAEDTSHSPSSIDVSVDGADQVAIETRSMIKGGGGALLKEKIILSSSKKAFILGDQDKFVPKLKRSVPIEVLQFAVLTVEDKLRAQLHGEPIVRKLDKGYPYYTESGNVILDCQFKEPIVDPISMEKSIKMMPGVVEAGIFNCKVDKFYKANQDGTFESF